MTKSWIDPDKITNTVTSNTVNAVTSLTRSNGVTTGVGTAASAYGSVTTAVSKTTNDVFNDAKNSAVGAALGYGWPDYGSNQPTGIVDQFREGGFNFLQEQGALKLDNLLGTFSQVPNAPLSSALSSSLDTQALFAGLDQGTIDTLTGEIAGQLGNFSSPADFVLDFGFDKLNNIVGGFSDIENFITKTVNVIPKDFESILGAVGSPGGVFDTLRQFVENIEDRSGIDIIPGNTPSSNLQTNVLRDFDSYNYIITLGILSVDQVNNPSMLRFNGGFDKVIVRSGGGALDKRQQIPLEKNEGIHAEYYIDNLRSTSLIQPNTKTGVGVGLDISFEVIEPYSMGNFLQSLITAAEEFGFPSFNDTPFCIKLEFVGHKASSATPDMPPPIYMPIQILDVAFDVSGQGSQYSLTCVPYSEIAFGDQNAETLSDITSIGTTVSEMLNGVDKSVTATLNQRIDKLEDTNAIPAGDRYVICFPKDPTIVGKIVSGEIDVPEKTISAVEQVKAEKGLDSVNTSGLDEKQKTLETVTVTSSGSGLFDKLDAFSREKTFMNEIGLELMLTDDGEGGTGAIADQNVVLDELGDTVDVNSPEAAVAEKARTKAFPSGSRIDEIIEKVIVDSEYSAKNAAETPENGVRKFFRINAHTYLDPNEEASKQLGRAPKIFVYIVVPFYADDASFTAPNAVAGNRGGIRAAAKKEYNYIYTGKNEDVIGFDINFNNAFQQEAYANFGMNQAARSSAGSDRKTFQATEGNSGSSPSTAKSDRKGLGGGQIVETTKMAITGDSRTSDIRKRMAETFHQRLLNSDVDLITAEIEIWGDPFYLPSQSGNYMPERAQGTPSMTDEGYMTYIENQVYIIINFRTPLDYSQNSHNMLFPDEKIVPEFSGIFQVLSVENTFEGGQFKQRLDLIRSRSQEVEGEPGTFVQINDEVGDKVNDNPLTGDEGDPGGNGDGAETDQPCNSNKLISTAYGDLKDNVSNLFPDLSTLAGDAVMSQIPSVTVAGITWSPSKSLFTAPPQIKEDLSAAQAAFESALENSPLNLRGFG